PTLFRSYAAPQTYTVEYFDGQDWQAIREQARTPAYPRGNYNHIQFPSVTGTKVRLTATHMPGQHTGIKELQVFNTGSDAPAAENLPPEVRAHIDPGYDRPGASKVIGTVRDDAAPSDELTVQWSVVDAPQDATVLIQAAQSATTVVRHSSPGDYTLRLTADDGAAQTSKDVHFTVTESDSSRRNVAPSATPSASFTAGWNDVNAVTDGEGRNSGGSQDEVWATWSGDKPDTQWLQYTWEEPVRINGTEIMFWSDTDPGAGTGVSVPESWNIQYLDPDSGEWTNVPDPSGYPTEPTGTNVTSFDAIVTTKLRATFNAYPDEEGTYAAVGVSEWEVYAEAPQSLEPIDVRTSVGELPELPETVTAVYSDGSRTPIPVQWPAVSE